MYIALGLITLGSSSFYLVGADIRLLNLFIVLTGGAAPDAEQGGQAQGRTSGGRAAAR